MKAMILAAGEGRRLGTTTMDRPKPMIEVGGQPILEHTIRLLSRYGVREIIINLHHCPEVVTGYFGDGSSLGVDIQYSHEVSLLGTAGAVKNVAQYLTETFLVIYGDNLTTCQFDRMIEFHRAKNGVATMALFHRENATASGIAELDSDDRIVRFVEKPRAGEVFSSWVNAGMMVLEPAVLGFIPSGGASDFGKEILPALLAGGDPVYGYRMTEGLWWVDSPEDLERTTREFKDASPV